MDGGSRYCGTDSNSNLGQVDYKATLMCLSVTYLHCRRLRIFMMSVLFNPMVAAGLEPNMAWRLSMVVPAVMFILCAISMKFLQAGLYQQAFGLLSLWVC